MKFPSADQFWSNFPRSRRICLFSLNADGGIEIRKRLQRSSTKTPNQKETVLNSKEDSSISFSRKSTFRLNQFRPYFSRRRRGWIVSVNAVEKRLIKKESSELKRRFNPITHFGRFQTGFQFWSNYPRNHRVFKRAAVSLIFVENLGGSFARLMARCWGSKMERAAAVDATSSAKSSLAES